MTVDPLAGKWFWPCVVGAIVAPVVVVLAVRLPALWEAEREGPTKPPAPATASGDGKDGERLPSYRRIYDAFPPLTTFKVVSAGDAVDSIADDEFVLGVEIGGEARAYPLNMLNRPGREIVNDTIGGEPVVVTFCGLCKSALVFSRRVDGRTLTFYVTGYVVDSNMLIEDVETRSDWIQILGESVRGPLKGKALASLPWVWTDWKSWRVDHPATTAVSFLGGGEKYARGWLEADASRKQSLIEDLQWGLARDDQARSWPFSELARVPVVNDSLAGLPLLVVFDPATFGATAFDRRNDGAALVFHRRDGDLIDDETGTTWDPRSGVALHGPLEGRRLARVSGVVSMRDVWRTFHPDGSVWSPDEPKSAPSVR